MNEVIISNEWKMKMAAYNGNYTFETLLYDKVARTQFFDDYGTLIKWCKDYGYYESAYDHAMKRDSIRKKLEVLDS